MMAFIAAIVPYLPVILQVTGFFLKLFGASESTLKKYQEMIDRANKEGHLSVEVYDRLKSHEETILARIEAKKKAAEEKITEAPPTP